MPPEERCLITTHGVLTRAQVGWLLAHEHVCANFYHDDDGGVSADVVMRCVSPELERARAAGITALVEATAVGGARRPDILLAVAQVAGLPLVLATGVFKAPAKAQWAAAYGESGLCAWMIGELSDGIGTTGVRAGWIKLSVTDTGLTPDEHVLLRAAAHASQVTGAAVGSHTVGAARAHEALDVFEAAGGDPARFIWIHTQTEPDFEAHMAFARRGAWIEYDAIGDAHSPVGDATYLDWVCALLDADLTGCVLLSHDRGGYNCALADGGVIRPYTYLVEHFVPGLRARGLSAADVDQLLCDNPFRAYAR